MAEGWPDRVDFCEGRLMVFVANARKVQDLQGDFDDEFDQVELAGEEEAREEGGSSSVDGFYGL